MQICLPSKVLDFATQEDIATQKDFAKQEIFAIQEVFFATQEDAVYLYRILCEAMETKMQGPPMRGN